MPRPRSITRRSSFRAAAAARPSSMRSGALRSRSTRWPGYVNLAPELGRLQREIGHLKVLMANGLYDLATPFFAVENTIAGSGIDRTRVTMTYYEAGHMMYVHEPSLAQLHADFRRL